MNFLAKKRFSPTAPKLPGIQILRGVAALLVLFHHVLEESQPLFGGEISRALILSGASGVDVFFVISGFIIFYATANKLGKPATLKNFIVHRFIRIVPLYWFCTALVVFFHSIGLYANKVVTTPVVFSSLFFVEHSHIIHGVGWTLNYEMYFYTVMAFALSFIFKVERLVVFICLFILAVLGFCNYLPETYSSAFFRDPIVVEFCFGVVIAFFYKKGSFSSSNGIKLVFLAIFLLIMASLWGDYYGGSTSGLTKGIRFWAWGVPAAILLIGAIKTQIKSKSKMLSALLLMGDASYSIYLFHPFVMVSYAKLIKMGFLNGFGILSMVIAILLSVAMGIIVHVFVERPMTAQLNAWWRKREPSTVT